MFLILTFACSSSPPPIDSFGLFNQCEIQGHMESCYTLGTATGAEGAEVALRMACQRGYRDSCRLVYQDATIDPDPKLQSRAFMAAVDGCTKSKDRYLCEQALEFPQRDAERFGPMLERFRTEIDAVLATTTPAE